MKKEKLLAVLRLQATKNIGNIIAKKLISATGSPEQIFRESATSLLKIPGIGKYGIQHLFDKDNIKKAEKELLYIEKNNCKCSYYLSSDYPKNLKHCIDSPILIFSKGNINFNTHRIISVVGTRSITNYGRELCQKIIDQLAIYKPIIISGFAYGADICAHKAAIDNGLQNIAVMAHGLYRIYPEAHKKYYNHIVDNGGFITEFWYKDDPLRENFLKRNRIIAGLSQATVVVESAEKGGALVTADIANSYGREVFALSGRANDMYSVGCNNLIKNNIAHLISSANDIVKVLNWDVEKGLTPQQAEIPAEELNEQELKIYNYLIENGKQLFDVIALKCDMPVYLLSSVLIQMELKGIVKPLPGKLFEV
ncbi:MAG: DNA-processing protein DprA [Tenacibaculum sp.]